MSEILSNIVLQPINSTFVAETNAINVNPEAIQLNIFTAGSPGAGQSSNGELLFNNNNNIDGLPNAIVTGTTLRFTNLANLKINGGTNSYFLQTDGTGNLTWAVYPGNISGNSAPGGANTQIQFNDGGNNFGGNAGFTFDKTTGDVNIPGNITVVGNINGNIVPNYANFAGTAFNVSGGNVSGPVSNAAYADNAGVANTANTANYANFAGSVATVTANAQPNITSLGTLTSLSVSSNTIALGNGANVNTGGQGVSIGYFAGAVNPGDDAVAIGDGTGGINQGMATTAIGGGAGRENQGNYSTAIGVRAGYYYQGSNSVAIGASAGNSGQGNNSIIINATGSDLNQTTANTFTVKPIRQANASYALFYNNSSGEITYDVSSNIANANYAFYAGNVVNNAQSNITSLGTLTGLTVSGQITSTVTTGTAPFVVTSTTQVANLNVATAGTANSVAGANVTGTVANATYASSAGTVAWSDNIPIGVSANAGNTFGIAIGSNTRSLGNGISIGRNAGRDPNGFAPGNNVIIINATGANLPYGGSDSTCFIAPMTSSAYFGNGTQELMWYNTFTKEVRSSTNGLSAYNGNITANNISASNTITSNNYIKLKVFVSANIANPTGAGAGARSFVSDATSTTFGALYAGGGANNVPVYSDGSAWRIG